MSVNVNGNIISSTGFDTSGNILNTPNIVTDGLVLWYDAGNLSSYNNSANYYDCGYGCQYYASSPGCTNCNTQIKDMSGLGNDGTLQSATIVYNNTGGNMNFDGSTANAYITCGNNTSLQISTNITMMAWVNPVAVTNLGNIVSKNANSGFRFRIDNSNQLWWYVSGNYVAGGNVPLNTWTHVTVKGTPSGLSAYVNTVSVASNAVAYSPTAPQTDNLYVGAYGTSTELFNGKMGPVLIYNKGLTDAEILQNFNTDRQRFGV